MTDQIAVVTGSSGAIGAATCQVLREQGYAVYGLDAQPPDAEAQANHEHAVADLTDPSAVTTAFARICADRGVPNVLVNNAGIYRALDFLTTSPQQFDAVYAANVRSAFLCGQEFARSAIAAGRSGAVVNVASVSGRAGSLDVAYGTSKGAVIALTKSMSLSLAVHDIRVNAVAPGIVISSLSDLIPPDRRTAYSAAIPLGRFAQPSEVAAVIVALAGETSSYMTGAVVDVNGGLY